MLARNSRKKRHVANASGARGRSQEIREGSRWFKRDTGYAYMVTGVTDTAVQVEPTSTRGHIDDQPSLFSFENFVADFRPAQATREYAANSGDEYFVRSGGVPEGDYDEDGPTDIESIIEANQIDDPELLRRLRSMKPGASIEFGHRAGEYAVVRRAGANMAKNSSARMRKNYSPHGFALVRDDGRIVELGRSRDYLETKWTRDRDLVELAAPHRVGDVITYDHRGMEVPSRGTMTTNTSRRYSRLEDNPQLFPEKFGVRVYAVTERGGGIGGLSPVDKESERVVLVPHDGGEYILVNPLEYDKDATVHVFHFGAYGDLNLIYLYAGRREGIEDGLGECGSWLAEHAPGHIMKPGSEEYMDLFNEAKQELIGEGEDPDDEELDGKAEEQAMTDQTYTESGWIASHEWGVTTLDKYDDVAKAALYVSKKLQAAHNDEDDEDDEED